MSDKQEKDLSFLTNAVDADVQEVQQSADVAELGLMVQRLKKLTVDIATKEEELAELKKEQLALSATDIPAFMKEAGLSEIKLSTGDKVIVGSDLSVTVQDEAAFIAFLKDRNEDDIIKIQLAFEKMESEKKLALMNFLSESGYEYQMQQKIHAATLKKYAKTLIGFGKEGAEYEELTEKGSVVPRDSIDHMLKLFEYSYTKIK